MAFSIVVGILIIWVWFGSFASSGELRGIGQACAWYWQPHAWTLLTAPLFLYLVAGTAVELYNWVFLTAYVSGAASRLFGLLPGVATFAMTTCVLILAPALWYSLLKNTPNLWSSEASGWFKLASWLGIFVGFQLGAYGLTHGALVVGGWMVDRQNAVTSKTVFPLPAPSPQCAEAIREYRTCGGALAVSATNYLEEVATVRAFISCYARLSPKLEKGLFWSTEKTTPEQAALLAAFLARVHMTRDQAELVYYSRVDMVPHAADLAQLGVRAAFVVENDCGEKSRRLRRVDAECVNY